jgi:hypothetical protein
MFGNSQITAGEAPRVPVVDAAPDLLRNKRRILRRL